MRLQVSHSPQKSSLRRSQLAACANMRASVYLPTPRGPVKSRACGTRSLRSAPRRAATIRSLPRNSEKPMYQRPSFAAGCEITVQSTAARISVAISFLRAHDAARFVEAWESSPSSGGARVDRTSPRHLPDGEGWLPADLVSRWCSCGRTCALRVAGAWRGGTRR